MIRTDGVSILYIYKYDKHFNTYMNSGQCRLHEGKQKHAISILHILKISYQINSLHKNSCLAHRELIILTFNLCSKENLHKSYHELRTWILHYKINEYIKLLKPCYITVDCYFSRWRGFQHSLISMAANKTFL